LEFQQETASVAQFEFAILKHQDNKMLKTSQFGKAVGGEYVS